MVPYTEMDGHDENIAEHSLCNKHAFRCSPTSAEIHLLINNGNQIAQTTLRFYEINAEGLMDRPGPSGKSMIKALTYANDRINPDQPRYSKQRSQNVLIRGHRKRLSVSPMISDYPELSRNVRPGNLTRFDRFQSPTITFNAILPDRFHMMKSPGNGPHAGVNESFIPQHTKCYDGDGFLSGISRSYFRDVSFAVRRSEYRTKPRTSS